MRYTINYVVLILFSFKLNVKKGWGSMTFAVTLENTKVHLHPFSGNERCK